MKNKLIITVLFFAGIVSNVLAQRVDFSSYLASGGRVHTSTPCLTSRATASSAEIFVMAMHTLPHVTIVGDSTGGGVGSPDYRELPNGWTYRLSTRYYADAQQRIKCTGVFPDVPVLTTASDSANGIDRILEKGIELIMNSKLTIS